MCIRDRSDIQFLNMNRVKSRDNYPEDLGSSGRKMVLWLWCAHRLRLESMTSVGFSGFLCSGVLSVSALGMVLGNLN